MKQILLVALSISMLIFTGCEREEGVGGKATITGKVLKMELREITEDTLALYYMPETRVYITYGDNLGVDDDVRTHFDGTYKFEYLRKGEYTIYAYSEAYENRVDYRKINVPVIQKVTISDKKGTVTVPDIVVVEYKKN